MQVLSQRGQRGGKGREDTVAGKGGKRTVCEDIGR